MRLFDWLSGKPSKDAFARRMTEAVRAAGVRDPIRYDAKEFTLRMGSDQRYNLANIYAEYCEAKKGDREDVLARFAQAARPISVPDKLDEAAPRILPRIRDRFFYESLRLEQRLKGGPPWECVHRVLAEHYVVELAYDQPHSILTLTPEHLSKWGVDFTELLDRAMENLRTISGERLKEIRPGLYVSAWQDNYDACRVLLTDLIRRHEVRGEPVVSIPHRDSLILTGSRDEAGLNALVEISDRAFQGPRPMIAPPMVLSEGTWIPVDPQPGDPAYPALKLLSLQTVGTNYKQQKDLLEAIHEKEGEDLFVASYASFENKEKGTLRSMCSWTENVVSLLPQTDMVALVRLDASGQISRDTGPVLADWADVARIARDLLKPLDLYPRRYRVDGFPTPARLAEVSRKGP